MALPAYTGGAHIALELRQVALLSLLHPLVGSITTFKDTPENVDQTLTNGISVREHSRRPALQKAQHTPAIRPIPGIM